MRHKRSGLQGGYFRGKNVVSIVLIRLKVVRRYARILIFQPNPSTQPADKLSLFSVIGFGRDVLHQRIEYSMIISKSQYPWYLQYNIYKPMMKYKNPIATFLNPS